jgi:hypothetical protein
LFYKCRFLVRNGGTRCNRFVRGFYFYFLGLAQGFKLSLRLILGLADGATGNIMLGYDPGDFPRNLMQICSNLFINDNGLRDPKDLLMKAFDLLQEETCYGKASFVRFLFPISSFSGIACFAFGSFAGSCTACVLTLDHDKNQLKVANIGDSGYRLIRNGRIGKYM